MTPTIEELEAKIRAAVERAQQEGWTITQGTCVLMKYKRCCPLGATIATDLSDGPGWYVIEKIQAALGAQKGWVVSFMRGFDGLVTGEDPSAAYALGQKFRYELFPPAAPQETT